jgi:hypothetical protein
MYNLAWKHMGFAFSRLAHQQTAFFRQRKTGAFPCLTINWKQLLSFTTGCYDTGVAQFYSD